MDYDARSAERIIVVLIVYNHRFFKLWLIIDYTNITPDIDSRHLYTQYLWRINVSLK